MFRKRSGTAYRDLRYKGERSVLERKLRESTTLYVGNLTFFTTEEQIYELFSKVGPIRRIIMGLDRQKMTPCGFCFVEYYDRQHAEDCIRYINTAKLDDRIIRVDIDAGFEDGRQFGRGKTGGQVRDDYRKDFDEGRGGYGRMIMQKLVDGGHIPETVLSSGAPVTVDEEIISKVVEETSSTKRKRVTDDDEDDY